jgi:hypothetical protein
MSLTIFATSDVTGSIAVKVTHTQSPVSEYFLKEHHELYYVIHPTLMCVKFICEFATSESDIKYCILLKVEDIVFRICQ